MHCKRLTLSLWPTPGPSPGPEVCAASLPLPASAAWASQMAHWDRHCTHQTHAYTLYCNILSKHPWALGIHGPKIWGGCLHWEAICMHNVYKWTIGTSIMGGRGVLMWGRVLTWGWVLTWRWDNTVLAWHYWWSDSPIDTHALHQFEAEKGALIKM